MRSKPLILIIDDEEIIHIILEKMVDMLGYESIHAYSNKHALKLIEKLKPDLVLLDIVMPGSDCLDIISTIKSSPALIRTGIILITATDDLKKIASYIEAGADDFLLKPFNSTLFNARITNLLQLLTQRRLQQDHLSIIGNRKAS